MNAGAWLEDDMQENTRRRQDRTAKNAGAIRWCKGLQEFLRFTGGIEVVGRADVDLENAPLLRLHRGSTDDASFPVALIFR